MSAPLDPIEWEATLPVRPSSPAWRATTIAVWGRRPLTPEDAALFTKLSGGRPVPEHGADFVEVVAGRRGGKSEEIARWVVFEAKFGGHEVSLAPGQTGVIATVCPETKHAKEVLGYVKGLAALPQVRRDVARVLDDRVTFRNGIEVRVVVASEMAVAATYVMLVLDEAARLPGQEAAVPDKAIVAQVLPGMAPIKGAPRRKFVAITSAHIDEGWAFETDRDNFGKPDADTLVLRGSTEVFNPNIDRAWLARERRKDAQSAAREYGDGDTPPEWQPALTECWFGAEAIALCRDVGRGMLARVPGRAYYVAVDAAFSKDNFGIAVVCNEESDEEGRRTVVVYVDAFRPPPGGTLSPRECVDRTVAVMRRYGALVVNLDQYCAPMLIESFADRRVKARQIPWTGTGKNAKAIKYRDVREAMRDGLVRLPDDAALLREFHRVRGRLTQQGHESIEASGKGVDDRVSAVVMACSVAREGYVLEVQRRAYEERGVRLWAGIAAVHGAEGGPPGTEGWSQRELLLLNRGFSPDEIKTPLFVRLGRDAGERDASGRKRSGLTDADAAEWRKLTGEGSAAPPPTPEEEQRRQRNAEFIARFDAITAERKLK